MIDKLKLGIDTEDWNLVIEFYLELTGTKLEPKKKPKPVKAAPKPPAVKAPTSRHADVSDFTMRSTAPVRRSRPVEPELPKPKVKPGRKKKSQVRAKDIKFVDTGEAVEDAGADQINDKVEMTPRTRKPFKLIVIECSQCHGVEEVNPMFKRDKGSYKCNECLMKGKINGPE